MRFLSVCSGIEAATLASRHLGWEAVGYAEIEPAACAVLKYYYPEVRNFGDFTKIEASDVGPIDLLCGGTPCTDFSVAGARAGLSGNAGNLAIEFLALAGRLRPSWIFFENVPGMLSSASHDAPNQDYKGDDLEPGQERTITDEYEADEVRDFGIFLSCLSELGYGYAWASLDAQYSGLAQRRERVFVVAYSGRVGRSDSTASDIRANSNAPTVQDLERFSAICRAVLFDIESLSGNLAPCRESGEGTAFDVKDGTPVCCVEGCEQPIRCKGLCNNHYTRLLTRGTTDPYKAINVGTCSIDGCRNNAEKKGWCGTHYLRWKKTGSTQADKPIVASLSGEERFWTKVERTDTCWLWTAAINEKGYGIYYDPDVKLTVRAHRYSFEKVVGKIPDDLELDHCCKVKRCVRPDHLEPVTSQENTRRYIAGDIPTTAGTLSARTEGGGGLGTDFDLGGGLSRSLRAQSNASHREDSDTYIPTISMCLNGGGQ